MATVRAMADADGAAVRGIWERAGLTRPWNDAAADIAFARATATADVLVLESAGSLVGAVMVGYDGHRGTVYYLGVDPEARGSGHGRALMEAAEAWLRAKGVWKLNLLVRDGNAAALGFYQRLGYGDQECRVLGRRLDGRADRAVPDDDAGVAPAG